MFDWSKYCDCIYNIYIDMSNIFDAQDKNIYEKKYDEDVHDDWALMG